MTDSHEVAADEIAAVEAAILLVSDVTSDSYQGDGSYIIAIADDGGDDAARDLARIAAALPTGWQIDWTGSGDSDGRGHSTSDARVWRDDDAEDAADGVPLSLTAGQRVDLDGVPHLLVGTLGCDPYHGDGTREADLLVEAGILGERVALPEEGCWAYPILRHDDRGLAAAACPEVEPYLAGRAASRAALAAKAAAGGAS